MVEKTDARIPELLNAAKKLAEGDFQVSLPESSGNGEDQIGELCRALKGLASSIEGRYRQFEQLEEMVEHINAGVLLEEVLDIIYSEFKQMIPHDRLSCALLVDGGKKVQTFWARNRGGRLLLNKGYSWVLSETSLGEILQTGQPRILNDLEEYYRAKPTSHSTRLILEEGMRSSMTCPLVANGAPIGFLFFSSFQKGAYNQSHVDIFRQVAGQMSMIVEKGKLISELAHKNEAIEEQNRQLKSLNELKNQFIGMAVHDLRNPLSSILGFVELMLDPEIDLDPKDYKEFLVQVERQSKHMLNLINDLLEVVTIESSTLKLHCKEFLMCPIIRENVRLNSLIAEAKQSRIVVESEQCGTVYADSHRLTQILDNLMSNAIKYSPPGSTIKVRFSRIETGWRVEVQDQGPGISPEDMKKLFQPFAKLSNRPTSGERSTGLGLAIVRHLVEAHGGQVGCESVLGKGSTFWFTLPDLVATNSADGANDKPAIRKDD